MKTNLTEIKEFLKNKHICLLGNAKSILKVKKDIDKFDVVCRMNRGTSQGKIEYIGSRTDILFISTRFHDSLRKKHNAKYVIWMTECQKLATTWIKDYAFQNPIEDWRALKSYFPDKKLPSTGILSIYFLIKYINFKSLTIYGFDFMKSGTWYHNLKEFPWHEEKLEKKLIMKWINERENVRIIIE